MQIKLAPVRAPYFDGAKLLVAADCTAFARADFHERFIKGRVTLVGCPKLDGVDYAEKLTEIIRNNDIKDVTVVRMEVPLGAGARNNGGVLSWKEKCFVFSASRRRDAAAAWAIWECAGSPRIPRSFRTD